MAETMREYEDLARESVRDAFGYDPEYVHDLHDLAHEVADSCVPVYTDQLLELAADNYNLAVDTPELGPAYDGAPTPINIIAANVYERLYEVAWDEIRKLGKEKA